MRAHPILLGAALLLLAAQISRADDTPEWATCISAANTGEQRLPACTAVIEGKTQTGSKLAAAYCIRGNDRTEKGELDAALADLNTAIEIEPTYACSYNNRGRVYGFKHDYDRAIADYDAAIKLDPKMAIAWNNRADALFHKGEVDRAITDLDEAIRISPNYPRAYANRGFMFYRKRDYARAIEDYSAKIRIAPDVLAYIDRGNAYRDSDQLDRAAADYAAVIKLAPTDARGWRNRGLIRLFKGDHKGGVADYNKAIEYDPADADFVEQPRSGEDAAGRQKRRDCGLQEGAGVAARPTKRDGRAEAARSRGVAPICPGCTDTSGPPTASRAGPRAARLPPPPRDAGGPRASCAPPRRRGARAPGTAREKPAENEAEYDQDDAEQRRERLPVEQQAERRQQESQNVDHPSLRASPAQRSEAAIYLGTHARSAMFLFEEPR